MSSASDIREGPGSILFVIPEAAGDLVLIAPVLDWIRQSRPKVRVGLLLRSAFADVLPLLPPGITPVLTPADPSCDLALVSPDPESLRAAVAKFDPEVLVVTALRKNWIHGLAAAAAPAARRISLGRVQFDATTEDYFRRQAIDMPGGFFTETIDAPADAYKLEDEALLIRYLWGQGPSTLSPSIRVPKDAQAEADRWLAAEGLAAKGFIICNPAGSPNLPIKAWSSSSFAAVLTWLGSTQRLPVVLCAHQAEKDIVDRVMAALGPSALCRVWLGTEGQFPVVAGLAARAKGYFGNDTSTLHVAEAVGTPAAGIYGGGTWPWFRPSNPRSIAIVKPLPCFGCGWDCHFGDAPCVKLIAVDQVIAALETWLAGGDSAAHGSRVVALEPLPADIAESIRLGRERYNTLQEDRAARSRQIIELSAIARRQVADIVTLNTIAAEARSESLARYEQIVQLTELGHRNEADIATLNTIAAEARSESLARYKQIVQLTELAHRNEADIVFLNAAAADLQKRLTALAMIPGCNPDPPSSDNGT